MHTSRVRNIVMRSTNLLIKSHCHRKGNSRLLAALSLVSGTWKLLSLWERLLCIRTLRSFICRWRKFWFCPFTWFPIFVDIIKMTHSRKCIMHENLTTILSCIWQEQPYTRFSDIPIKTFLLLVKIIPIETFSVLLTLEQR